MGDGGRRDDSWKVSAGIATASSASSSSSSPVSPSLTARLRVRQQQQQQLFGVRRIQDSYTAHADVKMAQFGFFLRHPLEGFDRQHSRASEVTIFRS
jgi:hypothetical protein